MSDRPFVPFYTSDFLAGTSGMTAATKGVYITLLSLMYEVEAPLPQSWETLARRSGCTMPSFRKAIEALEDDAKISITDAGIWSEKCDKHITQRRERSDSAKAAAKKRWEKDKEKQGQADATAYSAQCKPEPEPEPERRDTNVSLKARVHRFGEFWDIFPHRNGKKTNKPESERKYRAAVKSGVSEQAIIDAATAYRSDPDVLRSYGRGPVPWLNQKGWEDEPAENPVTPTNGAPNERPRTAQERSAAANSDVLGQMLAEGRRRDEERRLGEGEGGFSDPGGSTMGCGSDGDAVVTLFPAGTGPEGGGGGGIGLDGYPQPLSASGHRNGV